MAKKIWNGIPIQRIPTTFNMAIINKNPWESYFSNPDLINYVRDNKSWKIEGIGKKGWNKAARVYENYGTKLANAPLSAKNISKIYDKLGSGFGSIFDASRAEIAENWSKVEELYKSGKISNKNYEKNLERKNLWLKNLDKNEKVWRQTEKSKINHWGRSSMPIIDFNMNWVDGITDASKEIGNFVNNAILGASIAENPAGMAAAGWTVDSDGSYSLNPDSQGSIRLREILPIIGTSALIGSAIPFTTSAAISSGVKNIILPTLGGEIMNELTRQSSDGKYQDVGDFAYQTSGIGNLVNKTWAEDPARFVTNMINPGYYVPYGNVVSLIDDGINAAQKAGFFTPSEGIPADAIGMNLPKFFKKELLTIEKINKAAHDKNINISGVDNPTKEELNALNKYVKNQNNRKGEPMRQIFKEDGQFKYDYGKGTTKYNLDLNNLPNSNIGLWNWIKEHKWPFIGGGIGLTTGLGPYIVGRGMRSVVDAPVYFKEGFNPEPPKTSEPNKQTQKESTEAPIEYRIIPDSLLKKW